MKCSICKKNIETTFLGKLLGTRIKHKNKEYTICQDCQKKLKTKEAIIEKLPR